MHEATHTPAIPPVPSARAGPARKPRRALAPPFWFGCDLATLLRLWARNRFAIHPARAHVAAMNVLVSGLNSVMGACQHVVYSRRVAGTQIEKAPLFVIGHWRSGTTLLHELFALDEQFTYPTSLACFAPHHFLFFAPYAERWLSWLLPAQRAMDEMPIFWNSPQEDEFALCNRGIGSPYQTMAFPNHPPQGHEFLDLESLSQDEQRRWREALLWFLKQVTYVNPKRIVLKNPAHTARVKTLLEMFPDARFVHIVRDPYEVFFSTIKLWMRMYGTQAFQKPKFRGLQDYVFETYLHVQGKLDDARPLVSANRFHQVRYEELIADPVGQLREAYRQLELDGFEAVVPAIERYRNQRADHRPQKYPMLEEEQREIAQRWGAYFARYGYRV